MGHPRSTWYRHHARPRPYHGTPRHWLVITLLLLASLSACASMGPAPAASAPSVISIVNGSSEAIYYVWISGCTDPNWYTDLLDSDEVIMPGYARQFTQFAPGCWDMKVEFASGRQVEMREQRLRSGHTLTWTAR